MKVAILIATLVAFAASPAIGADPYAYDLQSAFAQHCIKCHGRDGKVKGKLDLLKLTDGAALTGNPDLIQDLMAVLDEGEMPPESEPALNAKVRQQMLGGLKKLLHAALAGDKQFARTPIRRMNRFQYNNSVRDLVKLNVDVFALPERMMREHGNYFDPASAGCPRRSRSAAGRSGNRNLSENASAAWLHFHRICAPSTASTTERIISPFHPSCWSPSSA